MKEKTKLGSFMRKRLSLLVDRDAVLLLLYGISGIIVFIIRIFNDNATESNTLEALLYFFGIFFSLGFGTLLQKKLSTREFKDNIRKYALSAYRRIIDIRKAVDRADDELKRFQLEKGTSKTHALDVVRAIIQGLDDTVQSSISDWSYILEEELRTIDQIEELNTQRNKILSGSVSMKGTLEVKKVNEITDEIKTLKSHLPQLLADVADYVSPPHSGRTSYAILEYYLKMIVEESYIYVDFYSHVPLTEENINKIKDSNIFIFHVSASAGSSRIELTNEKKEYIGWAKSPIDEVYSRDFVVTLLDILEQVYAVQENEEEPGFPYYHISRAEYYEKKNEEEFTIRIPFNKQLLDNVLIHTEV